MEGMIKEMRSVVKISSQLPVKYLDRLFELAGSLEYAKKDLEQLKQQKEKSNER